MPPLGTVQDLQSLVDMFGRYTHPITWIRLFGNKCSPLAPTQLVSELDDDDPYAALGLASPILKPVVTAMGFSLGSGQEVWGSQVP